MLTMKRKISEEKDRFGSFDSVIEIDEVKGKSYNTSQREAAETINYSTRRQAMNGGATRKSETMPQIKSEKKERIVEAIGMKTKMLLIAYVVVAVILAAVVIGTGVAISNASNKAVELEGIYNNQVLKATEQNQYVAILSDPDAIVGRAVNDLGMEKVSDYIEIELVDIAEPIEYKANTNWFDSICRFFSSIFN